MSVRRTLLALVSLLVALTGGQLATAAAASADASIAVRTVFYDTSRAGQYASTFNQAAQIWNSAAPNVRLVNRTPGSITILVDTGWPRAQVRGLGSGTVFMGLQAVNQGYFPLRIATHELGHILGLPDRRTGLCTDLMSGSSAPVSCRNANPSAREATEVNANFAGLAAATIDPARFAGTFQD